MTSNKEGPGLAGLTALSWCAVSIFGPAVQAAEADPLMLLKKMSEYVTAQTMIQARIDTDIEVVTPELQKIQFSSSSQLQLARPDKMRVERRGGYADITLLFDGRTLTLHDKQTQTYAQISSPGTTDQLIERLRAEYSVDAPGADLLLSNAFDVLTDDIVDAKYVGEGVVGGVDCDHLAFRDRETDWQIWIERGANPIPRKYVITSKTVAGAPQYTLIVREWTTGSALSASTFDFKPSGSAEKVTAKDFASFDEVPSGILAGEKQ